MDDSAAPSASATAAAATTAAFAATAASVVMIAQQVAARATRDALFLSAFSVKHLPGMVLMGAILSLVAVRIAARSMARHSPAKIAPIAFGANAAFFFFDWVLAHWEPRVAAIAIYAHLALGGATVISIFWSLISERFDPHTCKQLIGRIGAGGTAGGIVGGLIAWNTASLLSVRSNLAVMGIMNLVCVAAVVRIARRTRVENEAEPGEAKAGLEVLRESKYLQVLAGVMLLIAVSEALIDYVFNAAAAARFHGGPSLLRFFAIFHTLTALVTFGLQMGFARRALTRLGPAGTVAALPATVLVFGSLAFVVPGLWSAIALRGMETALSNSLFRSGYELFFTPLPPETKRPTKTLLDVGADRLGTALGSGVTMLVLLVAPIDFRRTLIVLALACGAAMLMLARKLHRGYIFSLEESLKEGEAALPAHDHPAPQASTTDHARVATLAAAPTELLVAPEVARAEAAAIAEAKHAPPIDRVRSEGDREQLLQDIEALLSGDAERIREVLAQSPLDARLVVHVLPLLGIAEHAAGAIGALRTIAARCTGQLIDMLRDPQVSAEVRRRVPSVLRATPTQRSADGLSYGLGDSSFEVRYPCGLALLRVHEKSPELRSVKEDLFAAVLREVELGRETWDSRLELEDDEETEEDFTFMDVHLRRRTSRGLQYVFALLAVALEREPIRMAFHALSTEDDDHRGTAMEYLENVLPTEISEALWPYLGDRRAFRPERRSVALAADKLLASRDAVASVLAGKRQQESLAKR